MPKQFVKGGESCLAPLSVDPSLGNPYSRAVNAVKPVNDSKIKTQVGNERPH